MWQCEHTSKPYTGTSSSNDEITDTNKSSLLPKTSIKLNKTYESIVLRHGKINSTRRWSLREGKTPEANPMIALDVCLGKCSCPLSRNLEPKQSIVVPVCWEDTEQSSEVQKYLESARQGTGGEGAEQKWVLKVCVGAPHESLVKSWTRHAHIKFPREHLQQSWEWNKIQVVKQCRKMLAFRTNQNGEALIKLMVSS